MAEIENTATIRVVADATGVEAGLRPAVEAARRAEQAVSQVGNGAATSARNVEAGSRNIVAAIQRTTLAMEAGGRGTAAYYEALARQRGIDPAVLAPYIAQLRAVEQAQARTAASAGVSAGQISAAMRTVPAQFTDIVTAIQGGQRPLTVLLQQGGQLRDQFGSAGLAARSLGGYVLGLVNPYTVAAGAVIGLAVAYKSGAEEVSQYARALALTGNAAGATADQLNELARQVGAVSGNRGAAAEAITALASTGQVSVDNLKQFGSVAADVQRVIGRSVSDTAADFAKLGKAPLSALTEINDKYHFITAATYAQVKALQDQGKAAEAADVAQKAYADGIDAQRQKVSDSLTDWERGWIRIKDATGGAVDAAIDFATGRGATNSEKITGLLEDRAKIEESMARARARNLPADVAAAQAELDANKRSIDAIRNKDKASKDAAKSEGDAAQATQARNKWLDEGDKYLSRAAQLERDVTKARNEGAAAHLSDADIEKRIGDIRKSYSDIFNAGIDSNIAALKRRDQVADVLNQREIARIQAQRALGGVSEADAINQTADAEDKAFGRHRVLLERELALTKGKANSIKEQSDLEGQIDVLDAQRTSRKIQRDNDLLQLDDKRRASSEALYISGITAAQNELNGLNATVLAQFDYNQEIGLSKTQLADLRAVRLEHAASLREETAADLEAQEAGSALAAIYREQAQALRNQADQDVFNANKEQRVDQWRQAVQQYDQIFSQGFADMLNGGSKGWSSFTKSLVTTFKTSVADQIYKMFARPFVVQMVGSFLGVSEQAIAGEVASQSGMFGGGSQATAGGTSSGAIGAAQAASKLYDALKPGGGMQTSIAQGVQSALEKAGASSQSASSAGQFAGQLGSTVGGYMIGSGINSAISGKYSTGSGVQTTEKIATAVASYFGGPIGGAIAGAVSGFVNRAFGMGPTELKAQGLKGTLSASSLNGSSYSDYHEDGGWFRSDKNWTDSKAFSADMAKQFTQGLSAIEQASSGFAQSLGVKADSIASYSKAFDIKLTGDATKDQQAVTDFFNGVGDEIAKSLVPNLDTFSKSGESASAALQRLASDFDSTTTVAQLLGKTAAEAFGSAGIESAASRERLVTLAGGTSTLTSQAQSYAQNYLTDDEKLAPVKKAVDEAMASLGLAAVQTRDQFKAIVNSLDLTTDAGAKEFTSLLALSDAFAQVHPATEAATGSLEQVNKSYQDQIDGLLKASMSAEQIRAIETKGMDASTVALYDRVAALNKEAAAAQERTGLRDQLDQLTLTSAQLLEKQRNALDASNQSIFDQIQAVQASKAATDAATQLATATAEERKGLQEQYDNLTMSSAQLLLKQRDALYGSNKALFDQIEAVKSQQSAAEEAAKAISAAQAAAAASLQEFGDGILSSFNGAKAAAKALRDFNDSLALGNLSALDPDAKYRAAKQQYEKSPGDTQAAQAFLQASKDRGADDFYYQRDFAEVQKGIAKSAAAKDAYALSLKSFWQSAQEMYSPAPAVATPISTTVPAAVLQSTMSKSSAQQTDVSRVEAKVDTLIKTLGGSMAVVADSTSKTADLLDRVTSGGNAMVNE